MGKLYVTSEVISRNYPKIRVVFISGGSDMCVSTCSVDQGFEAIIGNQLIEYGLLKIYDTFKHILNPIIIYCKTVIHD